MQNYSIFSNQILEKHQFQGYTNNCGPFCATMVINSILGLHLDGSELAEKMNHPHFIGWRYSIKRIPGSATFPWGIVDLLSEYKIPAYWNVFTSIEKLNRLISSRQYLIVLTAKTHPISAHYRILCGVHHDQMMFVDPAIAENDFQYQDTDSFIKAWNYTARSIISIPG